MKRRLLILSCSARKRIITEALPARDVYNGPSWNMFRNLERDSPEAVADVDLFGISAQYGLIPAETKIEHYDKMMSLHQAVVLRGSVLEKLQELMESGVYNEVCFGFSRLYFNAFSGYQKLIPEDVKVVLANGSMGYKLAQIQDWLLRDEGRPERMPRVREPKEARERKPRVLTGVTICGKHIDVPAESVLEIARAGLRDGAPGISRFNDWYVAVDEAKIAPKWLVGQLTGLSVSAFSAFDARRVLNALGVATLQKGMSNEQQLETTDPIDVIDPTA